MDDLHIYEATVHRIIDGDTVVFNVDLGFDVHIIVASRLARINAPEKNRKASKEAGLAATAWLKGVLSQNKFIIKTIKVASGKEKKGKYGRWLVEIMILDEDESMWYNVADLMVEAGHAKYQDY